MSYPEDRFTTTVAGAAGYEWMRALADDDYDDYDYEDDREDDRDDYDDEIE